MIIDIADRDNITEGTSHIDTRHAGIYKQENTHSLTHSLTIYSLTFFDEKAAREATVQIPQISRRSASLIIQLSVRIK